MHKVLEARAGGSFLGESQLEAMALRLFREWDLPEPVLQYASAVAFSRSTAASTSPIPRCDSSSSSTGEPGTQPWRHSSRIGCATTMPNLPAGAFSGSPTECSRSNPQMVRDMIRQALVIGSLNRSDTAGSEGNLPRFPRPITLGFAVF